jgi:hypothetical protein
MTAKLGVYYLKELPLRQVPVKPNPFRDLHKLRSQFRNRASSFYASDTLPVVEPKEFKA